MARLWLTVAAIILMSPASANADWPLDSSRHSSLGGVLYEKVKTKPLPKRAFLKKGRATVPTGLPERVQKAVRAGNKIASTPYLWGGGHGSFKSPGYDCSGSVSYVLNRAGLLDQPLVSGDLASWGEPGEGKYITIYANAGHTYMEIAGLRFDTSGASPSRWQKTKRDSSNYTVRHPVGL